MSKPASPPTFTQQADVFLSYARSDLDRARTLVTALGEEEIEVAFDVTHLMPGEDYAGRLDALLIASAKVVFLATPASLASHACAHELEMAALHGKPVLPVLTEGLGKADLPARLREVQYLRLGDGDLVPRLASAIRSDLEWERRHADYERLALHSPQETIAGRRAVQQAQDWLAARPERASPVSAAVRDLILRSQKRLRQRSRLLLGGLLASTLTMAGLAFGLYLQWQETRVQAAIALEQTEQTNAARLRVANTQARLARAEADAAETLTRTMLVAQAPDMAEAGRVDEALVALLDASEGVAADEAPTELLSAFDRVLQRAITEIRFALPATAVPFMVDGEMWLHDRDAGTLWRVGAAGPVEIATVSGKVATIARVDDFDGVILAAERNGTLAFVQVTEGQTPREIASTQLPEVAPEFAAYMSDVNVVITRDGIAHFHRDAGTEAGRLSKLTFKGFVVLHIGVTLAYDSPHVSMSIYIDETGQSYRLTGNDDLTPQQIEALPADGFRFCFRQERDAPGLKAAFLFVDKLEPEGVLYDNTLDFWEVGQNCRLSGRVALFHATFPDSTGMKYPLTVFELPYGFEEAQDPQDYPDAEIVFQETLTRYVPPVLTYNDDDRSYVFAYADGRDVVFVNRDLTNNAELRTVRHMASDVLAISHLPSGQFAVFTGTKKRADGGIGTDLVLLTHRPEAQWGISSSGIYVDPGFRTPFSSEELRRFSEQTYGGDDSPALYETYPYGLAEEDGTCLPVKDEEMPILFDDIPESLAHTFAFDFDWQDILTCAAFPVELRQATPMGQIRILVEGPETSRVEFTDASTGVETEYVIPVGPAQGGKLSVDPGGQRALWHSSRRVRVFEADGTERPELLLPRSANTVFFLDHGPALIVADYSTSVLAWSPAEEGWRAQTLVSAEAGVASAQAGPEGRYLLLTMRRLLILPRMNDGKWFFSSTALYNRDSAELIRTVGASGSPIPRAGAFTADGSITYMGHTHPMPDLDEYRDRAVAALRPECQITEGRWRDAACHPFQAR